MAASACIHSTNDGAKSWVCLQWWKMTRLLSFIWRLSVGFSPRINGVKGFKSIEDVQDGIPSEVTEIVLVRHGETTWNAAGRIQGQMESDLNEVGQKQAVAIAERLAKEPRPATVYSSDLKRAKHTALEIAENCFCPEVIEVPELKERHVGSLQGLFWTEGEEKEPQAYRAFFSDQNDLEIPGGGESFDQLCERSMHALEKIAKKHKGERVIVVTHGGVIRAVYMKITAAPSAGKLLNASVNVLHFDGKWSIKSWGDVSHLSSVGFLQRGFDGDSKH
ncbi:PREDICTED: metal-independent phosphoserine phosphatase [Tarenaya hassleriana]|uniref:metal-independent phosphoserine phosphatase n=1 Tax=Tarenaya hassleriana TaxID=28532 RepID=UPI00053C1F08|nr:PREDICTED: metal-independent phosphoserine phosphatase [Tarenaya hassleriana]